jgi:hypothetical protein
MPEFLANSPGGNAGMGEIPLPLLRRHFENSGNFFLSP